MNTVSATLAERQSETGGRTRGPDVPAGAGIPGSGTHQPGTSPGVAQESDSGSYFQAHECSPRLLVDPFQQMAM